MTDTFTLKGHGDVLMTTATIVTFADIEQFEACAEEWRAFLESGISLAAVRQHRTLLNTLLSQAWEVVDFERGPHCPAPRNLLDIADFAQLGTLIMGAAEFLERLKATLHGDTPPLAPPAVPDDDAIIDLVGMEGTA